jgi:hypothetical protein
MRITNGYDIEWRARHGASAFFFLGGSSLTLGVRRKPATAGGNPNIIWQAHLTIDNRFLCGGSILSQDTIVTAGHCMRQLGDATTADTTYSPQSVLVCMGTSASSCALYAVCDRLFIHPTYTGTTPFAQRIDLAVLKVSKEQRRETFDS